MLRPRSLKRWKIRTEFESIDGFLNPGTQPHVYSIKHNGTHLDLLIQDRQADTTLVVFHAALTKRAHTLPSLQGSKLAEDTNSNLIAVSDPSLHDRDLDLAWFLGDKRTGPLPAVYSQVIEEALNRLGSKRTILFGASGGGYAATLYGEHFPNSIVLIANPRLNLGTRPVAEFGKYITEAHQVSSNYRRIRARQEFATVRLYEKYSESGLPFDLCLYQNQNDPIFMQYQTMPFVEKLMSSRRLFVRFDADGQGHRPIPGEKLRSIVRTLSQNPNQEQSILAAGFSRPSENP